MDGYAIPRADVQFAPGIGRWQRRRLRQQVLGERQRPFERLITRMSGLSKEAANGALNFLWGKSETFTKPATNIYVALTKSAVVFADTGATLQSGTKEVTAAEVKGYKRLKIVIATDIKAAAVGGGALEAIIENEKEIVGPALEAGGTPGSQTVIGWAVLDKEGAGEGKIIMYGTCSSTVISSTQTPPTIAIGALKGEIKST